MPAAMDHDRFGNTPGNHWDTKRQCEFLGRNSIELLKIFLRFYH